LGNVAVGVGLAGLGTGEKRYRLVDVADRTDGEPALRAGGDESLHVGLEPAAARSSGRLRTARCNKRGRVAG